MYIKSYKSRRFAGLKDVSLEFDKGINVILGPNESGKSTIIDGIHSTLFRDIKIGRIKNEDKEFSFRFMPRPSGDYIDGKVIIGSEEGEYKIAKEWGSVESIELLTPDGNLLKNEKDIKKELENLLSFGESTYSNIVFAKQRDLKAALFNIIQDREITQEINDLLRMSLMELDGISIDSIEKSLEKEIDNLYKRWDIEKIYPENNKGINDPYKVGLGKIIESFYKKEKIKLSMEAAYKSEKEFEEISSNLKTVKDKREELSKEKMELEKVEKDVNNRALLNAEIGSIEKELNDLKKANKEWPMTEHILQELEKDLENLKIEKEKLTGQMKDSEKLKEKEILEKKLEKINDNQGKIDKLSEELGNIPVITKENIEELTRIQKELLTLETTMEAGKMIGILKESGDNPIYIKTDFEEERLLELNKEFQANGLIQIKYGDEFQLEIKTGEIDFEVLNEEYMTNKKKYDQILKDLQIDTLETGKLNLEKIEKIENEIKAIKKELEIFLDKNTKEEIEVELKGLEEIKISKSLEEIEKELKEINDKEIQLLSSKMSKSEDLKSWEEEYESHDKLFDLVVNENAKNNKKLEELEGLKPLPEEFESVDEFKTRLIWLKNQLEDLQEDLDDLTVDYHEAKNNLSEETYEELQKEHIESERIYDRNIKRGEKLLEIRKVFLETKERLAGNPMESLVKEFARLLEIITDGSYKNGDIDEDFKIKLENSNGEIPIELLSAGTYDSVTLALRFSLLKYIFDDIGGYVVLDDCLVDLDPIRKAQSVKLINDFAKDYQIIFTTCDPDTAEMLGGKLIEL